MRVCSKSEFVRRLYSNSTASLFALKPGEHAIETLGDDEDQTIP
jgi:hypothetical protein